MRYAASLVSFALAGVGCLASRETEACQPPPADLLGLSASLPEDGATGVPLDTGFVLFGGVVVAAGSDHRGSFNAESFELLDGSGLAVETDVIPWYTEPGKLELAWAPAAPLAAGEPYTLKAALHRDGSTSRYTAEQLAMGATITASFTTSSSTTAPLTVGALGVSVAEVEVDVRECQSVGDCGTSCTVVGRRILPELVVTLPDVAGGTDGAGYSAYFAVSAGAPLPFTGLDTPTGTGSARLVALYSQWIAAEGPNRFTLSVDGTAGSFTPCVTAIVWDPSGKTVTPEPACATVTVTVPPIEGGGGAGGGSGAGGSSAGVSSEQGGDAGTTATSGGEGGAGGHGDAGGSESLAGSAGAGGLVAMGGDGGSGVPLDTGGSSGRAAGTGGSVEGSRAAGAAGDIGATGASEAAAKDGGCGCRTSPSTPSRSAPVFALAAALLTAAVRRRRRLSSRCDSNRN